MTFNRNLQITGLAGSLIFGCLALLLDGQVALVFSALFGLFLGFIYAGWSGNRRLK